MFLPCRPCCGGGAVSCLAGCPAKTNTLRVTLSAQDYDWLTDAYYRSAVSPPPATTPTKMAFHFPGSLFNGTFDLTSTDGINYYYYFSACPYQSYLHAAFTSLGTPSERCVIDLVSYSPIHINPSATTASCSTYSHVAKFVYGTPAFGRMSPVQCSSSVGSLEGSHQFFENNVSGPWYTLEDAKQEYVSNGTAIRFNRATSSTVTVIDGFFNASLGGLIYEPYGTSTISGSDYVEVTSATFV